MIVLFGTGKFLEAPDKDVAQLTTQTFYGVIDPNTGAARCVIGGRSDLTAADRSPRGESRRFGSKQVPVRVTTQNTVANRGWYLDLLSGSPGVPPPAGFKGEMQVSDSILRNGRIIFTTLIPNSGPVRVRRHELAHGARCALRAGGSTTRRST